MLLAAIATMMLGMAYFIWAVPGDARNAIGELGFSTSKDGARLAFYDSGPKTGRVVVLAASLGRSVSDFNELATDLNKAGFRTVAVEMRGVARSGAAGPAGVTLYDLADDIDAALSAAGVPAGATIDVIGHAFGNRLVRAYASRRADRVRRMVLIAAGGAQDLNTMPNAQAALRNSFARWSPPPLRRENVRYGFFADDNRIPDYWLDGWYGDAAVIQAGAVRATPEAEWREAGGVAPILVLQAVDDRIAPPEFSSLLLKEVMPDRVELINIADAGHALLPEQPEQIAQAVIGFLQEPE